MWRATCVAHKIKPAIFQKNDIFFCFSVSFLSSQVVVDFFDYLLQNLLNLRMKWTDPVTSRVTSGKPGLQKKKKTSVGTTLLRYTGVSIRLKKTPLWSLNILHWYLIIYIYIFKFGVFTRAALNSATYALHISVIFFPIMTEKGHSKNKDVCRSITAQLKKINSK